MSGDRMSSSNESIQDDPGSVQGVGNREQQHAGSSGEGAASALAQLKNQHRQHRQVVDPEDGTREGPGE